MGLGVDALALPAVVELGNGSLVADVGAVEVGDDEHRCKTACYLGDAPVFERKAPGLFNAVVLAGRP